MKIKTIEGPDIELSHEAINQWRARLSGPVLFAGDTGYEESLPLGNAMIDASPPWSLAASATPM